VQCIRYAGFFLPIHGIFRGGSTGCRTRCNLKTGAWHHSMADAAWLHSFRVWTLHCLYLDYAYPYLRLYIRGTVHCLLAYCLVNPKNWLLWWKLGGTAVKKPQVWPPLALYRHVIILFMTFWPRQTSSVLYWHCDSKWECRLQFVCSGISYCTIANGGKPLSFTQACMCV